ncbi:hypothetical protein EMQ25_11175 [Arsenicitalea aurantiaca]|uniref:Uncharacterized protein n=1 Tax=Arsenicitalea aurantiaca TaxID=1783274 RepID=A0A433XBG3_9HYPH|nr:hypothetical protein [Arsenicitalea aurantiaca]RUT31403.1 hypothetical protein EMQ25_11175 [Arsenicitalea aurantiaca]
MKGRHVRLGTSIFLSACLLIATPAPGMDDATAQLPTPDVHLDCAATYRALSVGLPYLPGIFVMFTAAPRSGQAQGTYSKTTPRDQRLEGDALREEINRRYAARMAMLAADPAEIDKIIADTHACDALYGHEPVWLDLEDAAGQ